MFLEIGDAHGPLATGSKFNRWAAAAMQTSVKSENRVAVLTTLNTISQPPKEAVKSLTTIMMDIDGPTDDDFSQRTENFLQWFRSLPGATFHENIQIQDLTSQGAGRGVGK